MRRNIYIIFAIAFVLLPPCRGHTANPSPLFNEILLTENSPVISAAAADMNGDNKKEIAVVRKEGEYPHYDISIKIFRLKDGVFKDTGFVYHKKSEDTAYDFGDIIKGKGKELLVLSQNEVKAVDFTSGKETIILKRKTFLPPSRDGSFFRLPVVHTLNGKPVLILPTYEGFLIYNPVTKKSIILSYPPHTFYAIHNPMDKFDINFSLRTAVWFPKIETADHNGDGIDDIFLLWQDEVGVFEGSKGGYTKTPTKTYFLDKLSEDERRIGAAFVIIDVRDIDGNKIADFVINKYTGKLLDMRSRSEIILRFKDSPPKPVSVPTPGDKVAGALFEDLDMDGTSELIIVDSKTGIFSIIRTLLSGKLGLNFNIIPYDQTRGDFHSRLCFKSRIYFSFDVKKSKLHGFLPYLGGDFDGDGMHDALYATDERGININLYRQKDCFNRGTELFFRTKPSKKMIVTDLNGDSRSDIIFRYGPGPEENTIRILLNRGITERKYKTRSRRGF